MNTNIRSVKYNFIMNSILTVSTVLFPLITFPFATRVLGVDYYGNVSFGQSVISYFTLFSSLGIPTYGIRACAKVRDSKEKLSQTVKELLFLNILSTIFTYIVFIWSLFCIDKFNGNMTLLLISSLSIILNTIGVQWLFSALEQYTYITVRNIAFKIIMIFMMFVFVRGPQDYLLYALITVFGGSASNILNYFYMWKFVDFKQTSKCNFKPHLKPIFIFFASSAAINIYTSLDSVMLGFLTTDREVGLYTASIRLKGALVGLVNSLGTVLLPRMSYYVEKGMKKEYTKLLTKSFNFILVISLPIVVFFIMYAQKCLIFISGNEFSAATQSMQIIIPTLLLIGLSTTISNQILIPHSKEHLVCLAVWISAFIDFILNLFLIPKFGAAGASLATLIAELFSLLIQFIFTKQTVSSAIKSINYIKIGFPLIITSFVCVCFQKIAISNLFLYLAVNTCIFFSLYILLLLIVKEPFTLEITKPYFKKIHNLLNKSS